MNYGLIMKHLVTNIFMCSSLVYFVYSMMQLTQDFRRCEHVCQAILGTVRGLTAFIIAYFVSQLGLYHMCWAQI